jgi:hypothetical protein
MVTSSKPAGGCASFFCEQRRGSGRMWQTLEKRPSPGMSGSRTMRRGRLISRHRHKESGRCFGWSGQNAWFGGSRGALPLAAQLGALMEALSSEIEPGLRPAVIALSSA